jgi:malate/lactate dehydrogenase
MKSVAILGAGDLGGALAARLAVREVARTVILVDPDEGKAKGKALDLMQSGAVTGSDTRLAGQAEMPEGAEVVLLADAPATGSEYDAVSALKTLVPRLGRAVLVAAGAHGPALVEAAVRAGRKRSQVLGSAPLAWTAALRRRLASELELPPEAVGALVLGLPPDPMVAPIAALSAGGLALEATATPALRRSLEALRRRALGPVALAAAAVRVVEALAAPRAALLPVWALLDGELGHRRVALAVPAQVGAGSLQGIREVAFTPAERVAFDNAAQRRLEAA